MQLLAGDNEVQVEAGRDAMQPEAGSEERPGLRGWKPGRSAFGVGVRYAPYPSVLSDSMRARSSNRISTPSTPLISSVCGSWTGAETVRQRAPVILEV